MRLPVPIRRLGFRVGYALFRVYRLLWRPRIQGVKCVLTDGSRLLLVAHTYRPREWDLPGGAVKRREPPLDAARREMHEELGVRIEDWQELGDLFARFRHQRDVLHCFQASIDARALDIDLGEIAKVEWFSPDQLPPNLGRYVKPILARARLS